MAEPRMTIQTQAVLGALLEAEHDLYGLQIIRASGLAAGTIYPILQRLRGAGWVSSHWEPEERAQAEGRPARRYYALSPQGRARAVHVLTGQHDHRRNLARLLEPPQLGLSSVE